MFQWLGMQQAACQSFMLTLQLQVGLRRFFGTDNRGKTSNRAPATWTLSPWPCKKVVFGSLASTSTWQSLETRPCGRGKEPWLRILVAVVVKERGLCPFPESCLLNSRQAGSLRVSLPPKSPGILFLLQVAEENSPASLCWEAAARLCGDYRKLPSKVKVKSTEADGGGRPRSAKSSLLLINRLISGFLAAWAREGQGYFHIGSQNNSVFNSFTVYLYILINEFTYHNYTFSFFLKKNNSDLAGTAAVPPLD